MENIGRVKFSLPQLREKYKDLSAEEFKVLYEIEKYRYELLSQQKSLQANEYSSKGMAYTFLGAGLGMGSAITNILSNYELFEYAFLPLAVCVFSACAYGVRLSNKSCKIIESKYQDIEELDKFEKIYNEKKFKEECAEWQKE